MKSLKTNTVSLFNHIPILWVTQINSFGQPNANNGIQMRKVQFPIMPANRHLF